MSVCAHLHEELVVVLRGDLVVKGPQLRAGLDLALGVLHPLLHRALGLLEPQRQLPLQEFRARGLHEDVQGVHALAVVPLEGRMREEWEENEKNEKEWEKNGRLSLIHI